MRTKYLVNASRKQVGRLVVVQGALAVTVSTTAHRSHVTGSDPQSKRGTMM